MKKKRSAQPGALSDPAEIVIDAVRDGDWLPLPDLCTLAVAAAAAEGGVTVDLKGVDYLDAGALQIILALAMQRAKGGLTFRLFGASPVLLQWFEYAGAGRSSCPHLGHDLSGPCFGNSDG